MRFEIETLDCGMEALFARHRPQSEGTSARLVFNTGSLHENGSDLPGTCHYLEHAAILTGTLSYPTPSSLMHATDRYDTDYRGFTDWTWTSIGIDGLDAEYVISLCLEMGFLPRLTDRGIEHDRAAILEEARERLHGPYSQIDDSVQRLFIGDHPSGSITGKLDNISSITPQGIRDFHRKHWTVGNARLHVVSNEPVSKLRKYANEFFRQIDVPEQPHYQPAALSLPWLAGIRTAEIDFTVDDNQQALIFVAIPLETPKTMYQHVVDVAATDFLRTALWREVRFGRNITYHASVNNFSVSNTSHGTKENYNSMYLESAIAPSGIKEFMDAVERLHERIPKMVTLGGNILREYRYWLAGKTLLTRSELADDLLEAGQVSYEKLYNPDAEDRIVSSIRVKDVLSRAREMLAGERVVHIAQPTNGIATGRSFTASTRMHVSKPLKR